VITPADCW